MYIITRQNFRVCLYFDVFIMKITPASQIIYITFMIIICDKVILMNAKERLTKNLLFIKNLDSHAISIKAQHAM